MKLYLEKINLFLADLNKIWLIMLFIIINILCSLSFSAIAYFISGKGLINDSIDHLATKDQFLTAVIVAPLIETFIFQYAIIESIREKMRPVYACLISATAFALIHFYSVYYFSYAFISGLIFAYLYYLQKSVLKSIAIVLIAHTLYNLLIFIFRML